MKIKLTFFLLTSLFFVQFTFAQGDPKGNTNHNAIQDFTSQWEDDSNLNTHTIATGTGTAISSVEQELEVQVFPNPVSDILQIKYEGVDEMQIEIFNLAGVITKRISSKSNNTTINLQDLVAGNYYVRISVGNKTSIQKIVKIE